MIADELTLRQYVYNYTSYRYDIPNWSSLPNESITIIDAYNNSITYNSSLILSINDDIILDYHDSFDFNEIQHSKSPSMKRTNPTPHRRRLRRSRRKKKKKKKRKSRRKRRRRKSKKKKKKRNAISRWLARWKKNLGAKLKSQTNKLRHLRHKHRRKNRYATQGRFVGYFRASKRGSTFFEAKKYCSRKYGGLASINSNHENEQVKRVCSVILGDERQNGYYCWIGLFKPWQQWLNNRKVDWQKWASNQKHMTETGKYRGKHKCVGIYKSTGFWYHQRCGYRNGAICEKPHGKYVGDYIVVQKQYRFAKASKLCLQWYGTHLATIHNHEQNRNVRRACQAVGGRGHCWVGLQAPFDRWDDGIELKFQNWAPGEPNNKATEACTEIHPSSKWNNIPCRVHRYPVCNGKPLVDRMDNRLRWKLIREQYKKFRKEWARNQQRSWMEKEREKNSWQSKFKRMMMKKLKMRTRERFRDNLSTKFFNAQFNLHGQRKMGYEPLINDKMLYAMYYQKYGKFPKLRPPAWMKEWFKMFQRTQRRQKQRLKRMQQRPQQPQMAPVAEFQGHFLNQHAHIYGDLDHKPYMGDGRGLGVGALRGMSTELKTMQHGLRTALGLKKPQQRSSMNMHLNMRSPMSSMNVMPRAQQQSPYLKKMMSLIQRRRLAVQDDDDELFDDRVFDDTMDIDLASLPDRKCVLLANVDGLHEVCVGYDYVEVKKYMGRRRRRKRKDEDMQNELQLEVPSYGYNEIANVSDVEVDYIDYENWKYRKSVFIAQHKMMDHYQSSSIGYKFNLIHNAEGDVYAALRYEIMPFPVQDLQCWLLMNGELHTEICLFIPDDETIGFHIRNERVSANDLLFKFFDDDQWHETNRHLDDGIIEKCLHLLDMKLCVEVETDVEPLLVIQFNVLTLPHDEDQEELQGQEETIHF